MSEKIHTNKSGMVARRFHQDRVQTGRKLAFVVAAGDSNVCMDPTINNLSDLIIATVRMLLESGDADAAQRIAGQACHILRDYDPDLAELAELAAAADLGKEES